MLWEGIGGRRAEEETADGGGGRVEGDVERSEEIERAAAEEGMDDVEGVEE